VCARYIRSTAVGHDNLIVEINTKNFKYLATSFFYGYALCYVVDLVPSSLALGRWRTHSCVSQASIGILFTSQSSDTCDFPRETFQYHFSVERKDIGLLRITIFDWRNDACMAQVHHCRRECFWHRLFILTVGTANWHCRNHLLMQTKDIPERGLQMRFYDG
jgi:hypothetical protein